MTDIEHLRQIRPKINRNYKLYFLHLFVVNMIY